MIPDEAVEAAARVMLDKMYDDKTLRVDDEDRAIMRAALEAGAPYMMAEAWEQGRDAEFQRSVMKRQTDPNPYRSQS